MFKDPLQKEPTPYETLGIPFSAPLKLIQNALPMFMKGEGRKKPHLLGTAQQAARRLQSPKERASIDLFLYDYQPLSEDEDEGIGTSLIGLGAPTALDLTEMYCPMDPAFGAEESRVISVRTVKFSEIKSFDSNPPYIFQPSFER